MRMSDWMESSRMGNEGENRGEMLTNVLMPQIRMRLRVVILLDVVIGPGVLPQHMHAVDLMRCFKECLSAATEAGWHDTFVLRDLDRIGGVVWKLREFRFGDPDCAGWEGKVSVE